MNSIDKENLERIKGGFSGWTLLAITSAVIYISGVIDGIVHPKACS